MEEGHKPPALLDSSSQSDVSFLYYASTKSAGWEAYRGLDLVLGEEAGLGHAVELVAHQPALLGVARQEVRRRLLDLLEVLATQRGWQSETFWMAIAKGEARVLPFRPLYLIHDVGSYDGVD
jgi:hypothetical protein